MITLGFGAHWYCQTPSVERKRGSWEFVKSNRTVWRAKADFYRGGTLIPIEQRGEALATDLTGKLKDDGILKCDGRPV